MQYLATHIVHGRRIETREAPNEPIGDLIGQKVYVRIGHNLNRYTIDLSKMFLFGPKLDLTQPLITYLQTTLTDELIQKYHDHAVPVPEEGRFRRRLVTSDGHADKNVLMSFTSLKDHQRRNDPYSIGHHNDLVLTDPKRDWSTYLVSVNGVFHRTVLYEGELYVEDGFHNMRNSKKRLVGLYDTKELGGHRVIPISMDNIENTPEQDPWRGVYLNFPGVDFRNKTVLLVVAGYMYLFDGSYQVVGPRRLKVNTCQMDIINQWLHNPNTVYKLGYNKDIEDNQEVVGDQIVYHPTVHERIVHYLTHEYPQEERPDPTKVALMEFRYNSLYSDVRNITRTIDYAKLKTTAFLYKQLTNKHSFVVVINNPRVYLREYDLTRTFMPDQYESLSIDTPRGLLRYNLQQTLPFVVFSDAENRQHTFGIDYFKEHLDVYKTILDPEAIPAPIFDMKDPTKIYPVKLMELYSP